MRRSGTAERERALRRTAQEQQAGRDQDRCRTHVQCVADRSRRRGVHDGEDHRAGAVVADAPIGGAASSIAGACYLRAFLEQFYGPEHPQEPMADFAGSVVAAVLPALTSPPRDS
ncbi:MULTISPECIES: hypothetical protein [Rhodococcus]|uniref:Uncharacterized protein n=1 Tax=Rhodococcus rhodochrous TaxID=1829 RepID=A0AA47AAA7_RHORH|nr:MULTISPECIES: hypothetical protein [Rhodococcus]MCB8909626.1 hypothetical protein [Rhodococcus rhodochrous]MCD2097323.1 hypothetical protein [Rhodococcus rhodochrous]MCD2120245.1 hypothetical protein [Rhodococcus rhodochrous]MCQ4133283.1 hypothetical protein [Rhodococcus rhodochrous]MDJ0017110.1 hypothetical protein [Rhodococcus rhodochrous]